MAEGQGIPVDPLNIAPTEAMVILHSTSPSNQLQLVAPIGIEPVGNLAAEDYDVVINIDL